MISIDAYKSLLLKLCEIEKLNEAEKVSSYNKLDEEKDNIFDLRTFIEKNCKEYTDISYFYVVYIITISSKEESNYIEKLKNKDTFLTIKNIIENKNIKMELYHFNSDIEYIEKYEKDYNLLINGLNNESKIVKSNIDIAIEKFWRIFNV